MNDDQIKTEKTRGDVNHNIIAFSPCCSVLGDCILTLDTGALWTTPILIVGVNDRGDIRNIISLLCLEASYRFSQSNVPYIAINTSSL